MDWVRTIVQILELKILLWGAGWYLKGQKPCQKDIITTELGTHNQEGRKLEEHAFIQSFPYLFILCLAYLLVWASCQVWRRQWHRHYIWSHLTYCRGGQRIAQASHREVTFFWADSHSGTELKVAGRGWGTCVQHLLLGLSTWRLPGHWEAFKETIWVVVGFDPLFYPLGLGILNASAFQSSLGRPTTNATCHSQMRKTKVTAVGLWFPFLILSLCLSDTEAFSFLVTKCSYEHYPLTTDSKGLTSKIFGIGHGHFLL